MFGISRTSSGNYKSIEMYKQNLILLHGALGSSKSFKALIPYLSDNYNLIVPDMKWHGSRADNNSTFFMQDLVDDLEDMIQTESLQSASVFGFSMGGYVALSLALKRPVIFNRIMTLGTKLDWNPQQAATEVKMLNADKIQEKVPQFAQHLKNMHGEDWSDLCKQTAEMMLDLGEKPILKIDNISTLDLPVKLGLGAQDHMVSLEETTVFYKALKQGKMQILADCPHPIEKVNAEFLAQSIINFMK